MALRTSSLDAALAALDGQVAALRASGPVGVAIERLRADAAALRFHLKDAGSRVPMVVVLGGTGTGKSTLINRLVGADVTAASYRRTFTAGAIAVAAGPENVPRDWLALSRTIADTLPARGVADQLVVIAHPSDITNRATLVDTPDLDGDQ